VSREYHSDILRIAEQEGRPPAEVLDALQRWCFPIAWAMPDAIRQALANEPNWRAWFDVDYPQQLARNAEAVPQ
jgi:hypothetical protein